MPSVDKVLPTKPRLRRNRKKRADVDNPRSKDFSQHITSETDTTHLQGWGHDTTNTKKWIKAYDEFDIGIDFVGFTPSDDDNNGEGSSREKLWDREWDRGKRMPRTDYNGSRKRKFRADTLDQNDGYINKKQRVDANSRKAPWAENVDWDGCNNVAEMLHSEVEAFVQYISPTAVEHELRSMMVQLIKKSIESAFPDASVHTFGSFETKLYLPLGDLDLVVQSDYMSRNDKITTLRSLASVIRRAGIADQVTIIAKAKVPIIKFVTTHSRFAVDISINQTNGIAAGKMINRFLAEIPALRSLILVIKSFLNQRSMNEVFSGGLGSYSIVCLVISFLQMHPKVRRGEIDASKNLGILVVEFFELYGCYFNYEKTGISIRNGGSYFSKARRGWLDSRKLDLLAIEDPGDTYNDISKGSFNIYNVRRTFAGAYQILSAAAYLRAGIINARRAGHYVDFHVQKESLNAENMSILSSVMGVTQETINHRRVVQQVFNRGTLHRILGKHHIELINGNFLDSSQAEEGEIEEDLNLNGSSARKRRRLNSPQQSYTVYTTDEEDELFVANYEKEEYKYDLNLHSKNPGLLTPNATRSVDRAERKRAYWASKAIWHAGYDS